MNDNALNRPLPAVLPGHGVFVPGDLCAVLSYALDIAIQIMTRPAPVGVRKPEASPVVLELAGAARRAAIEFESARHRDAATARLAAEKAAIADALAMPRNGAPLGDGEIGVTQAARILGVSGQRVRQLTATGRIPARMAGNQWAIRRVDIEAYREWRGDSDNGRDNDREPRRKAG